MLTAVPNHWFSWGFTVMEGSHAIAEIDTSWWRESGEMTIQGVDCRVYREGMMSGRFILESAGAVLARAEKPSRAVAERCGFTLEGVHRNVLRAPDGALRHRYVYARLPTST